MDIGDLHEQWCFEANLSHPEVKINNGPEGERVHIHGESDWQKSVKIFLPSFHHCPTVAIRKHI